MGMSKAYLVVYVGDVHDKVDVVAKVVAEDTANDVLGDVVASMTHVACIIDGGTAIVPCDGATLFGDERGLGASERVVHFELGLRDLLLRDLPFWL